ncbi:hypothetical protein [Streptomyces sp. NPDC057386]|uniref:hypothetical protein n=1 Tax=unclassified Streptomyces TaxID=2593676 RepID=UPI00362E5199
MTAETTTSPSTWEAAVSRATVVADRERPGGMNEDCWDDVAIRDIITVVVLYALHVRHETPVNEVPWSKVLWWLWDDEHVIHLVEDTFPDAGQALTTPADELSDPLLARWRWLNRPWGPEAPIRRRNVPPPPWEALMQRGRNAADGPLPEPRWEGMSRGIAEALPDPALVMNSSGVSRPSLSHQSGGFGLDRVRWPASLRVSQVADKRYSFETVWRLAA